ncbi:MAG: hypothetical protein IJC16_09415 [Rikenellaceae bacterium]|nr:hypothetical protein [Rikenellaceae bacterium]
MSRIRIIRLILVALALVSVVLVDYDGLLRFEAKQVLLCQLLLASLASLLFNRIFVRLSNLDVIRFFCSILAVGYTVFAWAYWGYPVLTGRVQPGEFTNWKLLIASLFLLGFALYSLVRVVRTARAARG